MSKLSLCLKKIIKLLILAYIESFNVVSSKFVDNKFIEASKEFVKTAKEFLEEHEIIALSYIVMLLHLLLMRKK